jgi:adenylate kinase
MQRAVSRGRTDDNEEVIRHRLEVYRAQTEPLIADHRERKLLQSVAAEGTVDAVANRIEALLH